MEPYKYTLTSAYWTQWAVWFVSQSDMKSSTPIWFLESLTENLAGNTRLAKLDADP